VTPIGTARRREKPVPRKRVRRGGRPPFRLRRAEVYAPRPKKAAWPKEKRPGEARRVQPTARAAKRRARVSA